MKRLFTLAPFLIAFDVMAHHNQDHIVIQIDHTLSPPQGSGYLWMILGPVAVLIVLGLIRAIIRHRHHNSRGR